MNNINFSEKSVITFFFITPTLLLILGYFLFPYKIPNSTENLLLIPLFLGLIFLGIGFLMKKRIWSTKLKILGWIIFAFFWATQPSTLYFYENGDIVNAVLCIMGVYVLFYLAYREWLSLRKNEDVKCLNWIAGASFIAGIVYFGTDAVFLQAKQWLIETVAAHSVGMLNFFGNIAVVDGVKIYYNEYPHPVTIIFACTAIQSMLLFVGMILALPHVDGKRKMYALLATVPTIYVLNLVRNAGVVYLICGIGISFEVAHNVIGKLGSLVALVLLVFVVFKIIPELYDHIMCLIDLPKRNGPIEKFMKKYLIRSN